MGWDFKNCDASIRPVINIEYICRFKWISLTLVHTRFTPKFSNKSFHFLTVPFFFLLDFVLGVVIRNQPNGEIAHCLPRSSITSLSLE